MFRSVPPGGTVSEADRVKGPRVKRRGCVAWDTSGRRDAERSVGAGDVAGSVCQPAGSLMVLPRTEQPIDMKEIDNLPDPYPIMTSEADPKPPGLRPSPRSCRGGRVVAIDYGLSRRRLRRGTAAGLADLSIVHLVEGQ